MDENAKIRRDLARLAGKRLPGGCEGCDAAHEFVRDTFERFNIWVHHDPACPALAEPPPAGDR